MDASPGCRARSHEADREIAGGIDVERREASVQHRRRHELIGWTDGNRRIGAAVRGRIELQKPDRVFAAVAARRLAHAEGQIHTAVSIRRVVQHAVFRDVERSRLRRVARPCPERDRRRLIGQVRRRSEPAGKRQRPQGKIGCRIGEMNKVRDVARVPILVSNGGSHIAGLDIVRLIRRHEHQVVQEPPGVRVTRRERIRVDDVDEAIRAVPGAGGEIGGDVSPLEELMPRHAEVGIISAVAWPIS
jgi:hypothetical protein